MSTYLTVEEVADRLNASKSMVNRLVNEGRLAALDLNAGRQKKQRNLRIQESDLQAFIERGTVAPKTKAPRRRRRSPQQPAEKEYV